ncbi:MAG: hypothetical protein ACOC10_10510 [Bacteroidota bacterium]
MEKWRSGEVKKWRSWEVEEWESGEVWGVEEFRGMVILWLI